MFEPYEIAERIKLYAREKNMTVKSLLKDAGVGEKMVSNMSGKNGSYPQSDKIAQIAKILDCSVDYLLGRTNEPNGVYQNSNSGNIVNGNNGDNSPLTVNGKAAAPSEKKDTLTEQFMQKFEQLDFDDKVDVMQYVKGKNNT